MGECFWRYGTAPTLPDRNYSASGMENYRLGELNAEEHIQILKTHASKGVCDDACKFRVTHPLALNIRSTAQFVELETAYKILAPLASAN